jgi:Ca2+-binding RTX toxin-like protein
MHIESLETRRLLTATLAAGVLTVTGDAGNNHVAVLLKPGDTDTTEGDTIIVIESTEGADTGTGTGTTSGSVEPVTPTGSKRQRQQRRRGGGALRRINVPGFPRLGGTRTEFSAASVTSISIDLGAGNDTAAILRNVTQPATITGGDGNDGLSAGGGASTLNGNAGDDRLIAGPGAATLNGGDGNDLLFGGPAADVLNGDAGNDTLRSAGGGKDTVNGGADAPANGESGDIAFVDTTSSTDPDTGEVTEADVVTNVEAVRSGRGRGFGGGGFGGAFGGRGFGGFGGFGGQTGPAAGTFQPPGGFAFLRPRGFGPAVRPFGASARK